MKDMAVTVYIEICNMEIYPFFSVLRTHSSKQSPPFLDHVWLIIIFWEKDRSGMKKLKVAADYLLLDCCTVLHPSITKPIKK